MWKRQVANQQSRERSGSGGDVATARISLPSGEQIHDMYVRSVVKVRSTSMSSPRYCRLSCRSKLYQKHCLKDEQRSAHRISQEKARSAREIRSTGTERQPLDPEHLLARKLTSVPDVVSTKDRFASTAAYRSSTFASVVKEPYADPQAVGPGTYRAPRRAINVKTKQVPTPAYVSKAARFEEANAQVTAVLALASPTSPSEREYLDLSPRGAGGGGRSSPDKVRGPVLSTTPRFKSDVFPGKVSSAERTPHQLHLTLTIKSFPLSQSDTCLPSSTVYSLTHPTAFMMLVLPARLVTAI
ncbi:unnamed protein product [Phytophthora fragariaefolia]|uniref:Unnamed protein product n=1 Tax=Phytophthora fragariaefolia TaxID=1490495 RepID=A0A9W6YDV0_9STRA|nr:unnamed protein product [Phytophthora fragariaefolia]